MAATLAIKKKEEKTEGDLKRAEKETNLPLAKRVKLAAASQVGDMSEEQLTQLDAFLKNMSKE